MNDEIQQAVLAEREAIAQQVEAWAQDKRRMARLMNLQRAAIYEEIAAALDRVALSIRLRESVTV